MLSHREKSNWCVCEMCNILLVPRVVLYLPTLTKCKTRGGSVRFDWRRPHSHLDPLKITPPLALGHHKATACQTQHQWQSGAGFKDGSAARRCLSGLRVCSAGCWVVALGLLWIIYLVSRTKRTLWCRTCLKMCVSTELREVQVPQDFDTVPWLCRREPPRLSKGKEFSNNISQ